MQNLSAMYRTDDIASGVIVMQRSNVSGDIGCILQVGALSHSLITAHLIDFLEI